MDKTKEELNKIKVNIESLNENKLLNQEIEKLTGKLKEYEQKEVEWEKKLTEVSNQVNINQTSNPTASTKIPPAPPPPFSIPLTDPKSTPPSPSPLHHPINNKTTF